MIINQVLHGYDHGHNKLASSINLTLEDDNLMRVMSDWTGFSGLTENDDSYITCYTLPESGFYVVAKTWYAKEMPRPGSVWTHSFVINLEKTDETLDFRRLLNLFIRPKEGDYQSYFRSIISTGKENKPNEQKYNNHFDTKQIESLLYNIVNRNEVQYRIEKTNNYYQSLCLTLLQYLPIGILKELSLCTGTDYKSNKDIKPFNLTFNKNAIALLSKSSYRENNGYVIDDGVRYWSNSIVKQNEDDKLIKLFSDDIKDSAINYWLTGWLLDSLDKVKINRNSINYKDILSCISKTYPNKEEGILTKEVFLNQKVSNLYVSNKDYCELLCTTLNTSTIDWKGMKLDSYIVSSFKSYSEKIDFINKLINYEDLNEIGKDFLKEESFQFTDEEIRQLADKQWNIFNIIISFNHSILQNDFWLDLSRNKIVQLVPLLFQYSDINFTSWDKLFDRCIKFSIECSYVDAANIYRKASEPANFIMDYISNVNYRHLNSVFLRLLLQDIIGILSWLEHTAQINDNIILFIIDNINPQSQEVKKYGIKPWQSYYNFDKIGRCPIRYYIFQFLLSLNWKDDLALKMLGISFYNVYKELAQSKLELSQIGQLSSYMAELPIWQSWDNCKKLCRGTAKRMIDLGYPKSVIKNLTPDENINKRLSKAWNKIAKK